MTKQKYLEIEREIDNKTIMCLVETQEKYEKITERENLEKLVSRRKIKDKKGGGIMILKRQNNIKIEKLKEHHPDILLTQCQAGNLNFILLVTYISCNPKENNEIYEEIDKIINKYEDKPIMIIGDMNAHTTMIVKDKINKNGEKLIKWLNKYNLILLNNDIECNGRYTWEARNCKSVIDYALINKELYNYFKGILDLSDHMMMKVKLNLKDNRKEDTTTQNEKKILYKF